MNKKMDLTLFGHGFEEISSEPAGSQCRLSVWYVTFVSDMAFSSFFRLSWEEALAVALPSWDLILSSSSSSFSRSLSNVWAQLSHSGRQWMVGLLTQGQTLFSDHGIRLQWFLSTHLDIAHRCLCLPAPAYSCKLEKKSKLINFQWPTYTVYIQDSTTLRFVEQN